MLWLYKGENLDHNDCKMERWNFRVFWEKKSCTQIYFGSRLPCRANFHSLSLPSPHFPLFDFPKTAFICQSECRGNWVWNAGDWALTSIGYFGARLKIKPKQSSGKSWQIWNTFNLWPQQIIITSNPTSEIKSIKKKHNWTSGFIMRLFFSLSLFQIKFFSFF